MDLDARVALVKRHSSELLTDDELRALLERSEHPRAYIGFEPSGRLTIGHLVCVRKMRDLQEAGFELTVFLADWHAWINDKLGGSIPRISAAGEVHARGVHGARRRRRAAPVALVARAHRHPRVPGTGSSGSPRW